jgi:FlaA1/EpsC-like NDP-sugar epimerase
VTDWLLALSQTPVALAISLSGWAVPASQSIHIISIAVLLSSVLVTGLRVLGLAWRGQSVRQTAERFSSWAWGALVLLVLSGVVLIIAEPIRELMAVSLWIKMILLVIAAAISLRFLRAVRRDDLYADPEAVPGRAQRRNAVITLALWVAVVFMGRFIAFDPQIWGTLSPLHS